MEFQVPISFAGPNGVRVREGIETGSASNEYGFIRK
jgi:hypothetical protein